MSVMNGMKNNEIRLTKNTVSGAPTFEYTRIIGWSEFEFFIS
jgi:hypothetical protein